MIVGTTDTTILTAVDEVTVLNMTFCNFSAAIATITLHKVPSGGTVGNDTIILKEVEIDISKTYEFTTRLMLQDGDSIVGLCSAADAVNVIFNSVSLD